MNNILSKEGPVLNADGTPNPGYHTQEVLRYDRKAIKAMPWRIKEWDYYQIEDANGQYCLELTFGHASYIGQVAVMLFDIEQQQYRVKKSHLIPLPFGRLNLPASASEDSLITYHNRNIDLRFVTKDHKRDLHLRFDDFSCDISLDPQIPHAMIINVPFDEKETCFYYNYKLNCMTASGSASWTENGVANSLVFNDMNPAYGLLDWGRGVWPFHNEWFWSNGTGKVKGKIFGFNLGCGFGNTSHATENIFFYDGVPHKIGALTITHEEDWMKPWILRDEEGRCDLVMTPQFDRTTRDKILFVDNCCHQVFGKFNGTVILDDGTPLKIKDLPAFAEHAVNNW